MLSKDVLSKNRVCLNGLEGCGKSSGLFELLKGVVRKKKPVLFVYQTYKLMIEQYENWQKRYDLTEDHFFIAGHEENFNPSALEAYTNPEAPNVIPDMARFVFYSQSYLQRCRHYNLLHENEGIISRIVVDEFDYTKSIIPTFDYQFNSLMQSDLNNKVEKDFYKWLRNNYSIQDVQRLKYAKMAHKDGFTLAHWLQSSQVPVMFLTSEELSVRLLKAIGFDVFDYGVKEMKDCVINIEPCNYINDFFFSKMNIERIWEKFDYDLIISNKIDSFYQKSTEVLERPKAIPHITAKGSNEYRGQKVLTIISHIPDRAIKIIKDVFHHYGIEISFNETKALYYKAILLQSVGRVLGYRGSKQTDVLIHSSIWNTIKDNVDLPYSVDDTWKLDFEDRKDVLVYVDLAKQKLKTRKETVEKILTNCKSLSEYFVKKEGNVLTVAEVKQYLNERLILNKTNSGSLPVSKLAAFFNVECKRLRIDKKIQRCIVGLDFKLDHKIK